MKVYILEAIPKKIQNFTVEKPHETVQQSHFTGFVDMKKRVLPT